MCFLKFKKILFSLALLALSFLLDFRFGICFAQNMGINTAGLSPNTAALLDIDANPNYNKGLLIPRVTFSQRTGSNFNPLSAAAQGLTVYQTDAGGFGEGFYYNTSTSTTPAWVFLLNNNSGWALTGNAATTPSNSIIGTAIPAGQNYVGTNDLKDFVLATNNLERLRISSAGNIGIGTSTPGTLLDVNGSTRALLYTFPTLVGDPAPVITARTVPAGQGSSSEKTELILFHSNDPANAAGADQITLRAPALSFQTFNDVNVLDINNNAGYYERMYINSIGNVGIGTTSPVSKLSVGSSSEFQVNSTGDIIKINNVITSFPSSQGAANTVLTNNGSGTLTWAASGGGGSSWSITGNTGTLASTSAIGSTANNNFIGTTDTKDFVIISNNLERMRLASGGNIGIGNISPAATSAVDITSTTKGLLIPRMTNAQRNSISSPAVGLQIYNTDCNAINYWSGTCWIALSKVLPSPNAITCSGTTVYCPGESRTFSIAAVTGATSYTWSVPGGTSITSGQGTTSINTTAGLFSGKVCVTANNACETTNATCLTIGFNNPPLDATSISGNASPYPGQQSINYSISLVPGATSYNWTYSGSGFSISSGAGTSSITVNYSCSASAGVLTVKSVNNCGTSSGTTLSIAPKPNITASSGGNKNSSVCASTTTIGGSPTAADGTGTYTYSWSPSTGLSSTSIANPTTTASSTTTYTVTVTDGNSCSATSSMTFTAGGGGGSTVTFSTVGSTNWTVPSGVTCVIIETWGAQGVGIGFIPGNGGYAKGLLATTPGSVLNINVGGQTGSGGGGAGKGGANGGDASDVRLGGVSLSDRIIVAGGGGGAGGDNWNCNTGSATGHGGGGACGANYCGGSGGMGYSFCGTDGGATGGTSSAATHGGGGGGGGLNSGGAGANANGGGGVAGNGALGLGGASSTGSGCSSVGGGGGGYYGGGGAAGTNCGAGRGGGGSSWTGTLTSPVFNGGVRTGNGQVKITY